MTLKMSYVVVTDTFETIRDVVRTIGSSSMAADVELLIACPNEKGGATVSAAGP